MAFPYPRVEGVGFALPRFKQVTKSAGVPPGEVLDYLASLIVGVVVNHQHLPLHGLGKPGCRKAF
jgi:hypothetical protein